MRKRHCIGECDYASFFKQSGSGLENIRIYGYPYQRGQGIASFFKRYGIPLARWLGKQVLNTGVTIGSDYLLNKTMDRQMLARHMRQAVKKAAQEGLK